MVIRQGLLASCGIVAFGMFSVSAAAAELAADPTTQLEEVVVTAQKRSENLQQVPISAVVLGQQELIQQNLNSLADISQIMPSVHVGAGGRSDNLYIRGIGAGSNQGFDQPVGLFIDDIYHGRSRTSDATFLDLSSAEVLKGPQSTFFGNNSIAGAFNIVTNKPSHTFDASARLLYGQFGQYAAEGAVNVPISDVFAVRVAAIADGWSGWEKNVYTGKHAPDINNSAERMTLLFDPNENFDATLKVEGSYDRNGSGLTPQMVNCPPPAPFVSGGFCKQALALHSPLGIDNSRYSVLPQAIDLKTQEEVLTLNYRRWGQTFTSVSGFYDYHYAFGYDPLAIPLDLVSISVPETYHQFSQELRVVSPTDQLINYVGGLYFQTDTMHTRQDEDVPFLTGAVSGVPAFAPLVPYLPLGQSISFEQPEHSYSAFGSASWNATDQLKLTAGLRSSWVRKDYNSSLVYGTATQTYGGIVPLPANLQKFGAAVLGTPTYVLSGSRADHALLPSAKVQYQIDPQAMVYFSYARGFLAGGFNADDASAAAAEVPFAPEYVNAYEVGLKSEWFDHRLLVNLDVFRSDYTNLQVSQGSISPTGQAISVVTNAASSVSQGVELQGEWLMSQHFRLSTDLTYLDSYYVNYKNAAPTALQALAGLKVQDLSGRPTEFAPRWSGSVTGSFNTNLLERYQFTSALTTIVSSKYFFGSTGNDDPTGGEQSGYARLDGRLTFGSQDGRWAVDVLGRNLASRVILVYEGPIPTLAGTVAQQKEQPRNFAVQFRYRM